MADSNRLSLIALLMLLAFSMTIHGTSAAGAATEMDDGSSQGRGTSTTTAQDDGS